MARDGGRARGQLVGALQAALAAEHAAVWAYGLASAFLTGDGAARREQAITAHRALRDALQRRILAAGAEPVPTQPAYRVPEPVTDARDAMRLGATAERDTAAAWRLVVEVSDADTPLRTTAADALTGAAVRSSRWRSAADLAPVTAAFPGRPATS